MVISVDGPLGSGKTPLCGKVADELKRRGHRPAQTSALSGTSLGEFVRGAQFEYSGRTLAHVAAADRHLQLETVVLPAIQRGDPVVIDRYIPTAIALDGLGSDMTAQEILDLYPSAPVPNMSVLVHADADYRRDRLRKKGLLHKYEDWHIELEEEGARYDQAAELLTAQGWTFIQLDTPIENVGDEEVRSIVDRLLG